MLPAEKSAKGLNQGQMVENMVILNALGGECVDDMKRPPEVDEGLASVPGYRPPAAETARQWLDGFHDEALMMNKPVQGSFIPGLKNPSCGLSNSNYWVKLPVHLLSNDRIVALKINIDSPLVSLYEREMQRA